MTHELLINVAPREVRIALVEQGILQEIYIERKANQSLVGNLYKGKVLRVVPGLQAAFVDIGLDRTGFLPLNQKNPLHAGQSILVQVDKDSFGTKGPRLTTEIKLPGRYLVLTPDLPEINISQKIADPRERERLQSLIIPTQKQGFIFRTESAGASHHAILQEKKLLETRWHDIEMRYQSSSICQLIDEDIPIVARILRYLLQQYSTIQTIRVDDRDAFNVIQAFVAQYFPEWLHRIDYYASSRPLFDLYSIESELQKAFYRKIFLKSGGYLIFDQTEAMTIIDVNTGTFLGRQTVDDTLFQTNIEAAKMIARQIRLRNISGIIIIDFIDMAQPIHQQKLLETFKQALARDKMTTQVSEISSLGLVQMTRKRSRDSLENLLCSSCYTCQGRGFIKSRETMCYEIYQEIKRVNHDFGWKGFLVMAAQDVVDCLEEGDMSLLTDLAKQLQKPINIQAEKSYTREQYHILPFQKDNV